MIGWTVFENLKSFEFIPISAITLISNLPNSTYFEKPFGLPNYAGDFWVKIVFTFMLVVCLKSANEVELNGIWIGEKIKALNFIKAYQ